MAAIIPALAHTIAARAARMGPMQAVVRVVALAFAAAAGSAQAVEDATLLPKYGGAARTDAQRSADEAFLRAADMQYRGDRKAAAEMDATRGWAHLLQGHLPDAMRRFNQAWLLDPTNAKALWGMATLQSNRQGRAREAVSLFAEAERFMPADDVNFAIDQARAMGIAGAETKDMALLAEAFRRFEKLHKRAPQNVLNLQNWAITHYYVGNYADAWKKIRLAEATPRKTDLDPGFIAALSQKMPRPP